MTLKQLELSLKKKYSPSTLAKLKKDGLVDIEKIIKRSTLKYKYEKVIQLAKNSPTNNITVLTEFTLSRLDASFDMCF